MRFLAVLLLAMSLAGCSSDGEFFTGYVDGVTMDARHDRYSDGDCFSGSSAFDRPDERCHWVRVEIDNTANPNDLDVNRMHWHGEASNGGVYDHPQLDGPDAIAAGANGVVTLGFTLGPSDRITELRFGAFDDIHMKDAV